MVFMKVASWGGGGGCQDSFACLLLSLPRRPDSACSVKGRWQGACFLGRSATCSIRAHAEKKKITQCPFSSNAGIELKAVSLFRHQACLPASAVPGSWPRVPLPGPGLRLPLRQPAPRPPVCAPSPGELLKPNSSDSNSPSLAIYQPVSWAAASGCLFLQNAELFSCYFI